MKNFNHIFTFIALTGTAFSSIAYANCGGDTEKNTFIESWNPNDTRLSFSGTGETTVAQELLSYLKQAGSAGGVVISRMSSGAEGEGTSYRFEGISAYTASNVCPPLNVSFQNPEVSVSLNRVLSTNINFKLTGQLALSLVKLLKAVGTVGTSNPNLPGETLSYRGKNVNCLLITPSKQDYVQPSAYPAPPPLPVPGDAQSSQEPSAQCLISLDVQH